MTSKRGSLQPDAITLLAMTLKCFKVINLYLINIRSNGEIIAGEVKVVTFFLFSNSIDKISCTTVFFPSLPIIERMFPGMSLSGSI